MNVYDIFTTWKEEYGEVSYVFIDDIQFFFRLITRNEFNTLKQIESNDFVLDEMVVSLCVLDPTPDDWDEDIYAGVTSTLARTILEESLIIPKPGTGEDYIENLVNKEYNEISGSFERQMPIIIAKAFPSYTIEEIRSWPLTRQIKRYAEATWLLNEIDAYGIQFSED